MSASLAAWQPEIAAEPERRRGAGPPGTAAAQHHSDAGHSEAELVSRSRAGEVEAFGALYHRYEAAIFRHALHVLENADDADDVRQETFVRAFRSLPGFRGDASLKTYLLTICSNLCRDRLRGRRRRPECGYGLEAPEPSPSAHEAADPSAAMARAVDADRVHRALRRLPAHAREVLILRHVEEMGFDEIAAVLGCTRVSAPVRLFRARRQFKDAYMALLRDEEENVPPC